MSENQHLYPSGSAFPASTTAAELQIAVRNTQGDFVTFCRPSQTAETKIPGASREGEVAAVISLKLPSGPENTLLRELPDWVIPFLPLDDCVAAVTIRRECLSDDRVGEFREVVGALREWLMRAVQRGQSLRVLWIDADGEDRPFPLPALRPEPPAKANGWIGDAIDRLDLKTVLPRANSPADLNAVRAGLFQVNDFLDRSHEQSQNIEGEGSNRAGDYWHGIMHRREPDYSNAKYWFRRIGTQPVYGELADCTVRTIDDEPAVAGRWKDRLLPGGAWDPFAFIDLCQSCPKTEGDSQSQFARRVQWCEMLLLLRETVCDTGG